MKDARQMKTRVMLGVLAASMLALAGCKSPGGMKWLKPSSDKGTERQVTPEPTPVRTAAEKEDAPKRWRFLGSRATPTPEPVFIRPPVVTPIPTPVPPLVAAQTSSATQLAYRLKPGDPIVIVLTGPAGLNDVIEQTVDERGFVKLTFIGSVRATGRTATELEREIEAEYTDRQKIYKEVYATVHVPNTFYFIGGEVRQPGRFPLVGRVTLSQAVVAAGNFTEWARPSRITIVRNNRRIEVDFREIKNDPSKDVELKAGDVITVDRSFM